MKQTMSALRMVPIYLLFAGAFSFASIMIITFAILDGEWFLFLFVLPFLGVSIGFWTVIFLTFHNLRKMKKALKYGVEGIGFFESLTSGMSVNNVQYNKIKFSYKDEQGEVHIVTTLRSYSTSESSALKKKSKFKIKHYKGYAVIDESFKSTARAATESAAAKRAAEEWFCRYCGRTHTPKDTLCKSCGAPK